MDFIPPAGSRISVVQDGDEPVVVIPVTVPAAGYFSALVSLFVLFMFASPLLHAASQMLSGNGNPSLVLWVGLAMCGCVFAAHTVYRAYRRPVAETLKLRRNGVNCDGMALATILALFHCVKRVGLLNFRNGLASNSTGANCNRFDYAGLNAVIGG